jgi:hypothetical protein
MQKRLSPAMGQRAIELIHYLRRPEATRDALRRLEYFKQHPLENWIDYFEGEGDELLTRGKIHIAITTKDIELKLARRLNLVKLWATLEEIGGTDRAGLNDAKVPIVSLSH